MSKVVAKPRAKPREPRVGEDYLELVKSFPLRPLRSHKEFTAAGAIVDRLMGREDLTPGQRDYLAAILRFVEDYEHSNAAVALRRMTPSALLRHLMEENDMTAADLGYVLGSRGLASEVLNGNRGLSKTLIAKLARRFRVDPGLFLDVEALAAER